MASPVCRRLNLLVALPILRFVLGTCCVGHIAYAQGGEGIINLQLRGSGNNSPQHPCMVSLITEGEVVQQQEKMINDLVGFWHLRPGVYEVRVEGEAVVTEVKRGIRAFAGQTTEIIVIPRVGMGTHVVEYATGALSREEIAQRLKKLEALVAELQQKR